MDNLTNQINEIRERADIVDVISRYINVIHKGKGYYAICPFHDDTNPSLSISQDKQIFKCFVCNEGGNVFTFLQKYKKIPYMKAVKEVADMVGIDFKVKEKVTEVVSPQIQVLYYILQDAKMFYMNNLKACKEAIDYCKNRNLTDDIIKEFEIGYSFDSESVIKFLLMKGYSKEDIYRSGIALEENGKLIDRFSSRLIFPITSLEGKVVAFSGRIIAKVDMAKYVNSPETPIFVKGNTLYHYAKALDYIKKEKKVYICEGYMDTIALYKAGINNAIALMGTAFTKEHLKVLKYLGVQIILTLDGDNPGNINANKLASDLTKLEIPVQVIPSYGDVKDVDEYLNKYGKEKLVDLLNTTLLNPFEFSLHVAKKTLNLENNEEKKKFLHSMCKKIAMFQNEDQDIYIEKLHKELHFSINTITNLVKEYSNKTTNNDVLLKINEYKKTSKYQELQLRVLSLMLDSPEAIQTFIDSLVYLENDSYRKLAMIICEYYKENSSSFSMDHMLADLFTKVESEYEKDDELNKTLLLLDSYKGTFPNYSKNAFLDLLFEIKEIAPLEHRLNQIQEDIKFANTIEEKNELIKESLNIKQTLKEKRMQKNGR